MSTIRYCVREYKIKTETQGSHACFAKVVISNDINYAELSRKIAACTGIIDIGGGASPSPSQRGENGGGTTGGDNGGSTGGGDNGGGGTGSIVIDNPENDGGD